ncbi:MAG: hypothetical protein AAF432_11905, partial [Planctomycetota bacterium]
VFHLGVAAASTAAKTTSHARLSKFHGFHDENLLRKVRYARLHVAMIRTCMVHTSIFLAPTVGMNHEWVCLGAGIM